MVGGGDGLDTDDEAQQREPGDLRGHQAGPQLGVRAVESIRERREQLAELLDNGDTWTVA